MAAYHSSGDDDGPAPCFKCGGPDAIYRVHNEILPNGCVRLCPDCFAGLSRVADDMGKPLTEWTPERRRAAAEAGM